MLKLIAALHFCGFEDVSESGDCQVLEGGEVWEGGPFTEIALGVTPAWLEKNFYAKKRLFWRSYPEPDPVHPNKVYFPGENEEVVLTEDRIIIVDRTHHRIAVTCRCEPEGCALAAEIVRSWFATGR